MIAQSCLYGGTYASFQTLVERWGVEITYVSGSSADEVRDAMRPNTKLLYLETIANPTTQVVDIPAMVEAAGREEWLTAIRKDLVATTYRPAPVRRVMIPKPGGGERPLGIPTIRDRVVQTAAKLVLEPIFEADLDPAAFGYRPKRSGTDAIKDVHRHICRGYSDVVDADLSAYFDTIPHRDLMQSVARRIVDRHVLWLIKLWLKEPVEERDGNTKSR